MSRTIRASEFARPDASVVGTAEAIAEAIVAALHSGEQVVVDLHDIRGVPTSFFNVVLLRVRDAVGAERLERDLSFEFGSAAQRAVFERSMAAVRAAV